MKKLTELYHTSNPLKKSNVSELPQIQNSRKAKSNTPSATRTLKLNLRKPEKSDRVQPVTSKELKELLNKRRELLKES